MRKFYSAGLPRCRSRHTLAVIARLDRAIQYCEAAMVEPMGRGVLDAPPEPVIGLAKGETRWRGMTEVGYRTVV
ncbi:hypothetical protein XI09_29910 [Bradyrhizobium sp. CCBAU 11386]|nr:hypothetical protein [Bradyrhizobium sp. CCBAU 11386]